MSERLSLYNQLSALENEEALIEFERDLIDRFGPLPSQAEDLLNSVRLKWRSIVLGLERLILKKGQLSGYFIADQESAFYQSETFSSILNWVQQSEGSITLKEKETRQGLRLRLAIKNVNSIETALKQLTNL